MYIKVGFRVFFIACRCFPDGVNTGTHTKNCIQIKKKKSYIFMFVILVVDIICKKVQVGNDQEMA